MNTAFGAAWPINVFVYLVRLEDRRPLGYLMLKAHAGANVGVDSIRVALTAPTTSWVSVSVAPVSSAILRAWAVISCLGKYPFGEATVQCVPSRAAVSINE